MTAIDDALKSNVLEAITLSSPKAYWRDCRGAIRQAYMDAFQQVANDPNLVDAQRIHKLHQDRHFRMEHTFFDIASKHKLPASPTLLQDNGYTYVYVATARIGFTQSYVPYIGALPHPAKYWEKLAEGTGIPRLALCDEPEGIMGIRNFYGLLTHNPVGKRFTEEDQKLGMIQFSVPSMDAKEWVVELAIEEIVSAYPQAPTQEEKVERTPRFKQKDAAKKQEDI